MLRLVLPLFLFSQYAAAIHVRAPNSSIKGDEVNMWLITHIVPLTWYNASVHCQLDGGILASPTTQDIAKAMLRAITIDAKLSSSGVFIGVSNMQTTGHFVSLDGAPFADIPLEWAAGEPNNANDSEKCVAVTGKKELADVSCIRLLPFFCLMQSTHNPSSPIKLCKGKEGYDWEYRTGSCYKFHPNSTTWYEAVKICEAEGGYLAIVNSKTESSILLKIFKENKDKVTGSDDDAFTYALLGFQNSTFTEWRTVHGQTLSEAGFEEWASGEPNNPGVENCGSMHNEGGFNDIKCDILIPFICEMDSVGVRH